MEDYVGAIRLFAFGYTPEQWLPCNGALLSVNDNQMLFSLLGVRFGGDGRTTFGLPNMNGNKPLQKNQMAYYICANGIYPNLQQ